MGRKVSDYAYALERWDLEKNELGPDMVGASSKNLFHWKCPKCKYPSCVEGSDWLAAPSNIALKQSGCPNCAGRVLRDDNNLEALYPSVAALWHPTKNGELKPSDCFPKTHESVFWYCPIHDFYQQEIATKTSKPNVGCNKCNAKTSKPEIRIYCELQSIFGQVELRPKVFGKEIDIYLEQEQIGIEFDGEYFHRKRLVNDEKKNNFFKSKGIELIRVREKPLDRISENDVLVENNTEIKKCDLNLIVSSLQEVLGPRDGCEAYQAQNNFQCEEEYQNKILHINMPAYEESLASLQPELIMEWCHEKNAPRKPEYFTPGSSEKVWWRCSECSHLWQATIHNRTTNCSGCPNCANKVLNSSNNLLALYPEVAFEFHPTKNNGLKPEEVWPQSNDIFWWLCKNEPDHEWSAAAYNRTHNGTKCPFCTKTRVTKEHNLEYLYPALAAQYDEQKNKKLARECHPVSQKFAHWKCDNCGYKWKARIQSRVNNFKKTKKLEGCSKCRGPEKPKSFEDSFAFKYPLLAAQWDTTLNSKLPEEIKPTSRYLANWLCKCCGHKWSASVRGRVTSKASGKCKRCGQTSI